MAITDFTIIRRSMAARLFSTVTTILTVAVAVGLMLVLLSMRDSGRQAFERGSGDMHIVVSRDSSPLVSVLNSVFYANAPQRPLQWAEFEQIAESYPLEYAVPIQQGDSYRGHPVVATTAEFFTRFNPDPAGERGWAYAEGRAFETSFEVVLGSQVAKATGLNIGDGIFLTHGLQATQLSDPNAMAPHEHRDYQYIVVGILEPTGGPHDRALFSDLTSSWIVHAHDRRKREDPGAITTAEDLIPDDQLITGIYLRVASRQGRQLSGGMQQVFDMLRRNPTLTVANPDDQVRTLFAVVANIDQVFLGMAFVVMLSSGIAIMLALYNSMQQRRRQIAVLRVLGCSKGRIFGLVVTESAMLGLLGAFAGFFLAFIGAVLVAEVMKQRLGLVISPSVPVQWALAVALGAVAIAALAGLIPAASAYKTSVARNLRPLG